MLAATTIAFGALYKIKNSSPAAFWPFWLAIAVGILVKGPVIAGIIALSIVTLCIIERDVRWLKRTRPLLGLPLLIAVVAPWLIVIGLKTHGTFFEDSLGHDLGGKLASGEEHHGSPPGVYLLEFPLSFWPGSLAALLAIPFAWRNRREPAIRFLLAWIVPGWLLFEAVPTKLPHYVLPLFPGVAVLTALSIKAAFPSTPFKPRGDEKQTSLIEKIYSFAIAGSLYLLATGLLAVALIRIVPTMGLHSAHWSGLNICTALVIAVTPINFAIGSFKRDTRFLASGMFLTVVAYVLLFGTILPNLKLPFPGRTIAQHRQSYDPQLAKLPLALIGYHEPSAVLWLGRETQLTDAHEAAVALANGSVGLAFVTDDEREAFLREATKIKLALQEIDHIEFYNYNHGHITNLTGYRRSP